MREQSSAQPGMVCLDERRGRSSRRTERGKGRVVGGTDK